jgi:hypothetical protein
MALSGRDTGSSQIFVTLVRAPHLDGAFSRVGHAEGTVESWSRIAEGDRIEDVGASGDSRGGNGDVGRASGDSRGQRGWTRSVPRVKPRPDRDPPFLPDEALAEEPAQRTQST